MAKASQETGINKHTLYRWHSGADEEITATPVEVGEIPTEAMDMEGNDASPSQEDKSARKRYSAEEKANALRLYARIGVTKASKQTGITISSLRKWRMDAKNEIDAASATADEIPKEQLLIKMKRKTTMKA